MSYILPAEGCDLNLGLIPRNTESPPASLWLGLGTSQTASTVPAFDAVLATQAGVNEMPNVDGYARQEVLDSDWTAPVTVSLGREIAAAVVAFQADAGTSWDPANFFFLADSSVWGAGRAYIYMNFSDLVARTVIDTIPTLVVPRYRFGNC